MDLANDFNKHFTNIGTNKVYSASNSDLSGAYDHKTHADSNIVLQKFQLIK